MKIRQAFPVQWVILFVAMSFAQSASASVPLGTGNSSLLGGDLTDPEDKVVDTGNYGGGEPEEKLRPPNATWVKMTSAPVSPPGTAPHQIHAYQSWQNSPACAIFLNKPEARKWYISFIDGGNGGPTEDDPFYCAVQLKRPYVLTHFTITTAPEMPDRDPRQWVIQGSNTGDDDDWTDIYHCDATGRSDSPFQVNGRLQTTLFTAFTTDNMAKVASPDDQKKLAARLTNQKIEKADFANDGKGYAWFRIAIYSCFNPNSTTFTDFNRPPGFSLGQLELFGVPGTAAPSVAKARGARVRLSAAELIKPEAYDPAFIIMPWVGPPKEETTLQRFEELADCGFNVSFPPNLWDPVDDTTEKFNLKYLDICQKVGLKALVWDGSVAKLGGWGTAFKPEEIPQIEKVLDGMIARYSSHPAFLGFILGDEGNNEEGNHRLGFVNQYLLKKDPKHLPYYNLLPAYAFKPLSTYDVFVSNYIETVKPALMSWDHYRQMFGAGDESTYWYNLELMRKKCTAARIPFNQIIVSNKHMGYRECSEIDLRWQVFTSLAYGSRGIQYFTYWFTPGLAWADAPALISKEGKRDVKWGYVKKINHRIAKLGPTLARLTSTGAYCTVPRPPGARKLSAAAPVKKADGGPLVIGCFQDPEGKQYFMVVNRAFNSKVTANLTMNERITSAAEISQETGKPLAAVSTSKQPLAVPLEPGEGKLFVLSESGLFYQPPDEIYGGKEFELANIEFEALKPENKSTGTLFWRAQGETQFASLPLTQVDSTHFKVTLPSTITKAPFEYYIEMQESGEKPVREPELGAQGPLLATPDLAPPTAVSDLVAPIVKSYRVALGWKPATDDRSIAGYRLYRGTEDKFPISEKALLTEPSAGEHNFTDDSPPLKQTAWYAVQAVDVVGREGDVSYLRIDVPDHQPPDNKLSLRAVPGSKSVMLAWSGELEPIVSSIEIHRGEGPDGPLQKVGEVTDVMVTRYLDKDSQYGTQYRYALRPLSREGLLGEAGPTASASPLRYLKRINCGGPEIISDDGVAWEADKGRGHANLTSRGTATWTVRDSIVGTGELKEICQTERWANRDVNYSFEVDPGRYEVVLLFAETNKDFFVKGKRTFDIVINGQVAVEKMDVFSEAGAALTPWQYRKVVDVAGRELKISAVANRVGPAIKGIEIRGLPPE